MYVTILKTYHENRSRETDDYSSDLDTYSDNTSECKSDNCSDYESDIETSTIEAKKGISLLDAYKREELADKLVIQVEQDKYKKFSVIDDISEVYRVSGVNECINEQQALRPVIDIDAPLGDIKAEK
ncbi:4440_t:CDS:2, partial [Cetraspora pellucida]